MSEREQTYFAPMMKTAFAYIGPQSVCLLPTICYALTLTPTLTLTTPLHPKALLVLKNAQKGRAEFRGMKGRVGHCEGGG